MFCLSKKRRETPVETQKKKRSPASKAGHLKWQRFGNRMGFSTPIRCVFFEDEVAQNVR